LVCAEDNNTNNAHYAYYLKITRKTFLCLKLNSQLKYQQDKALEIADMFLLRRWLNYMKIGV